MRGALRKTITYMALGFVGLFMLLPFLWMLSTSVKPAGEVFASYDSPLKALIPREAHWRNYGKVYDVTGGLGGGFARWYLNSLFVAACVTLGQVGGKNRTYGDDCYEQYTHNPLLPMQNSEVARKNPHGRNRQCRGKSEKMPPSSMALMVSWRHRKAKRRRVGGPATIHVIDDVATTRQIVGWYRLRCTIEQ